MEAGAFDELSPQKKQHNPERDGRNSGFLATGAACVTLRYAGVNLTQSPSLTVNVTAEANQRVSNSQAQYSQQSHDCQDRRN
jgi:hypothetical protein